MGEGSAREPRAQATAGAALGPAPLAAPRASQRLQRAVPPRCNPRCTPRCEPAVAAQPAAAAAAAAGAGGCVQGVCIASSPALLDPHCLLRTTDGECHEIQLVATYIPDVVTHDTVMQFIKDGPSVCHANVGDEWTHVRSEEMPDKAYRHFCRRCGLPKDAVLMW